jgi:hypothetical protein
MQRIFGIFWAPFLVVLDAGAAAPNSDARKTACVSVTISGANKFLQYICFK